MPQIFGQNLEIAAILHTLKPPSGNRLCTKPFWISDMILFITPPFSSALSPPPSALLPLMLWPFVEAAREFTVGRGGIIIRKCFHYNISSLIVLHLYNCSDFWGCKTISNLCKQENNKSVDQLWRLVLQVSSLWALPTGQRGYNNYIFSSRMVNKSEIYGYKYQRKAI